jgi:hypothetical protein
LPHRRRYSALSSRERRARGEVDARRSQLCARRDRCARSLLHLEQRFVASCKPDEVDRPEQWGTSLQARARNAADPR